MPFKNKPSIEMSLSPEKIETSKKAARNLRHWFAKKMPMVIVLSLVLLMLVIFFWPRVVITIHSGESGVFYSLLFGGTDIDYAYPEGLHIILPWDVMTIYDTRVQTVLHEFSVLTNRGLPIGLKIAIRYRPELDMLGKLHQDVGPNYVQKIIIPQIESVLRKGIGEHQPEDIYTNKQGILTSLILSAIEETGRKYVIIDDIIIRSLELPPTVQQAIEDKLVQEQILQTYLFKNQAEKEEAERKRIEAQGIHDYQAIISKTLDEKLLKWQGVQATLDLAKSNNSKIVIIGAGKEGLPLILNVDEFQEKESPKVPKEKESPKEE